MTTEETIAGLRAARALVAKGWTQNYYARDEHGEAVEPDSGAAVCWCAEGACFAEVPLSLIDGALMALCDEAGDSLPSYNDAPGRTLADVLALFDRTIARLEAQAVPS